MVCLAESQTSVIFKSLSCTKPPACVSACRFGKGASMYAINLSGLCASDTLNAGMAAVGRMLPEASCLAVIAESMKGKQPGFLVCLNAESHPEISGSACKVTALDRRSASSLPTTLASVGLGTVGRFSSSFCRSLKVASLMAVFIKTRKVQKKEVSQKFLQKLQNKQSGLKKVTILFGLHHGRLL
eukprot:g1345.t1